MSPLAPIQQGFLTDKLFRQRQASPHTIAAYRDTCKLLLTFAWRTTGTQPTQLVACGIPIDKKLSMLRRLRGW